METNFINEQHFATSRTFDDFGKIGHSLSQKI